MRSLAFFTLLFVSFATPAASADAPACGQPNRPPRMIQAAAPNDPPAAVKAKLRGTVAVVIRLADDGTVRVATAVSGPEELRKSAEDAARRSTYEAEFRDCAHHGGLYTFVVEFDYQNRPPTPTPAAT